MQITTNTKLIERQSKIARYTTFAGLGVLLISLISSWTNFSNLLFSYASLFIGLIFAYIGSALANKWIREPRADKALEKALKGFDNKYHLYNYLLPSAHTLLTPNGLTLFLVKPLDGTIICRNDKWQRPWHWGRLVGGMGQEPLGNPSADLQKEIEKMRAFIEERFAAAQVNGYIVFTDPRVRLDIENASMPYSQPDDLKKTIRQTKDAPALAPQILSELEKFLNERVNAKTAK